MPRRIDTTSLVDQARDSILLAILDGEFGDKLPPEEQLAEMLNVSRTTIRSAIQGLESEGLLSRKRAAGTTIHRQGLSALALRQLIGFDQFLRGMGYEVKVEIEWERAAPPKDVNGERLWGDLDDAFVQRKTYLADGEPAIVILDVVPWVELKGEPRANAKIPPSLFEFASKFCVRPIERATIRILPMVATKSVPSQLDLPVGTAFIRLHETHDAKDGSAIAWSIIDFDDDLIQLEIARG